MGLVATGAGGKGMKMSAQEKKWQAEDDLRTLQRAAEIRKDKGRLAAARKCAKEQMAALQKVSQE